MAVYQPMWSSCPLYDMKTFLKMLMSITIESCKCLFFRGVMKLPFLLIPLLKHIQLLKDCMDEFSLLFGEVTAINTRKSQGVRGRQSLSTETYSRCCTHLKKIRNIKERIITEQQYKALSLFTEQTKCTDFIINVNSHTTVQNKT